MDEDVNLNMISKGLFKILTSSFNSEAAYKQLPIDLFRSPFRCSAKTRVENDLD